MSITAAAYIILFTGKFKKVLLTSNGAMFLFTCCLEWLCKQYRFVMADKKLAADQKS